MNPKLVAAVLVGGTFVLGGGSALLAELPSPSRAPLATPRTATAMRSATAFTPASGTSPTLPAALGDKPAARGSARTSPATSSVTAPAVVVVSTITYAVKTGDTPSSIARWLSDRGYGPSYQADKSAVLDSVSRVLPGELISYSNGKLTVQPPS